MSRLPRLAGLVLLSCLSAALASRLAAPAGVLTAASAPALAAQPAANAVLVPTGATWRYLDDGSDQGSAWRAAGFDDSAWAAGPAQLGYGDGDEQTPVGYGPDPNNKHVTTYFRQTFSVPDTSAYGGLLLSLLRDDGAVVYLNGIEILRSNMPAGTVTAATWAASAIGGTAESDYETATVGMGLLADGLNVLAVEVHQANATSSDISFDLSLAGIDSPASCPAPEVRFAVIGDFGNGSQAEQDVATLVSGWAPDFVLTTGDDNYPAGGADTIDAHIGQFYHQFIGNYKGSYGAGASGNNFYPALGNHDWDTNAGSPPLPQPYLDYFTLPGSERYYTVARGPVAVFVVDSDPREPDGIDGDSTQAAWLHGALAASTAPWRLVTLHHPPFSSGPHGSTATLQWPFADWGATAVLAGHDHSYERLLENGGTYIINGLGGADIYPTGPGIAGSLVRYSQDHGAMLLEASQDCLNFKFITHTGAVIDNFTLTKNFVYVPLVAGP